MFDFPEPLTLLIIFFINYTIEITPLLFQIEFLGNPLLDIGNFVIERFSINVVLFLSATILEPIICELVCELLLLFSPAKIEENSPSTLFLLPPLIIPKLASTVFPFPPLTIE